MQVDIDIHIAKIDQDEKALLKVPWFVAGVFNRYYLSILSQ